MIFNSLGSGYSWLFALRFALAGPDRGAQQKLENLLAEKYGGRACLYYRGRAALCEAVRLSRAEHVATSSFSCYAVEQAISAAGARPVFLDIEAGTFHFGLKQLKAAHRDNSDLGAVIVQNTFGLAGAIKPLAAYCQEHKLVLIEDLAHCPDNSYSDGPAFGQAAELVVLSFGRDKQIDVVGGGALIIRQPKLAKAVEVPTTMTGYRYKRLTARFYPFMTTVLRAVYGFQLSAGRLLHEALKGVKLLQAANDEVLFHGSALPAWRSRFVLEQFESLSADADRRRSLFEIYNESIAIDYAVGGADLSLSRYPLLLSSPLIKELMLGRLKRLGFLLEDHWYDTPVYPARLRPSSLYPAGSCPRAEVFSESIVNLPLHRHITPQRARQLGQMAGFYAPLSLKTDFTSASWQEAWQTMEAENCNLLTSWEEGEAYAKSGHKIWRLGLYRDRQLVALALAVLVEARRGRFLKVPGGPLFCLRDRRLQAVFLERLRILAREQKCAFVRLQPYLSDNEENRLFMRELKLRPSPASLNGAHTLKIDLTQPTEDILGSKLYKNTRYYISKAKRSGLAVREDNTEKALADFLQLLEYTQKNQDFVANRQQFIKTQFQSYARSDKAHLYQVLEKDTDELLAGAIVIDQDGEAAYLYGASSKRGQALKAPYLLQWQAIVEAQKRGLETYNLWGAAPPAAGEKHRFAGLTRFKRNFSNSYYSYLPSHDAAVDAKRYWPVYLWEIYETKKRRL